MIIIHGQITSWSRLTRWICRKLLHLLLLLNLLMVFHSYASISRLSLIEATLCTIASLPLNDDIVEIFARVIGE